MSSFAAAAHGIQSHHSTSTSNTSTSSISISSSYSTPSSATNHNNNLPPQNYQQSNLHHHHNHSSNHSQFQSHQGQSPLHYSTDNTEQQQQSRRRPPLSQHNLVTSNEDGTTNIIPLSPPISATAEQKYLSSPSSTGSTLSNAPHLSTSTIEHLGPITPPSTGGILNIQGIGGVTASSTAVPSIIQLPQTPEDPIVLQQHALTHHQHSSSSQQHHDLLNNNHPHNPHVSVHQRLAPTIQQSQHHNNSSGGTTHNLVAHQSGGGLIHTSSSVSSANRHSNPSSPLDADEEENQDHPNDLGESNTSAVIDHGQASGGGGRQYYSYHCKNL